MEKFFSDESFKQILKNCNNSLNISTLDFEIKKSITEFTEKFLYYLKFIKDLSWHLCELVERKSFIFCNEIDIDNLKIKIKQVNKIANNHKYNKEIIYSEYFEKLLKIGVGNINNKNNSLFENFIYIE